MVININYGNRVVVVPASALTAMTDATAVDMRVLWAVASKNGSDISDLKTIADELGTDISEITLSLNFWQTRGVLTLSETVQSEETAAKPASKEAGAERQHRKP